MEKRTYIKPALEVVLMQGETMLASLSQRINTASEVSGEVEWDAKSRNQSDSEDIDWDYEW